jgi:DNA-binding response OmpR family regulator
MTAELESQPDEMAADRSQHRVSARAYSAHGTETSGAAHLLVVDPRQDDAHLREDLANRGVHVTWVESTLQGLIEFGRVCPAAVIVSADARGVPATEFVATVSQYETTLVIAGLTTDDAADAGRLMLAGAGAVVTRPYGGKAVWEVMQRSRHPLDDQARVSFGPIELDARSYSVRVDGERIADLPLKEFELLRVLLCRAPEVLTDEEVRASLWGNELGGPTDNTIAVHAARLRNRLQGVARVRRIRGRGYSLTLT